MEQLRFPIGRFDAKRPVSAADRPGLIEQIASAPAAFRSAVSGLDEAQLDAPYREGGWTLRQLVHHVPDSHMNAFIRFKWTLTEDVPQIKTYDEAAWATLPDVKNTPIETSLALLEHVHTRWVHLLRGLDDVDWARRLAHPEWGQLTLDTLLAMYAWHGRHHTAHVTALRERNGW